MATTSGKYLTVTGTGFAIAPQGLRQWSWDDAADNLDATDSASAGIVHTDGGCVDHTVTITLLLRAPATVKAGTVYYSLSLFQEVGVTPADAVFSQVSVLKTARSTEVRGQKQISLTLKPCHHPSTGAPCTVVVGGA